MKLLIPIFLFLLSACAGAPKYDDSLPLKLKPSSFDAVENWGNDNLDGFIQAYARSCEPILKRSPDKNMGPGQDWGVAQGWQNACRAFAKLHPKTADTIRTFFEGNFIPYKAYAGSRSRGLFTGYYEASLNGSRKKHGPYQYPLHARPDDLIMVQLGDFRDDLKGRRIAGRVIDGRLRPYESRAEIVDGKLPDNQEKILVWVDDPVDAFFVQVQGSGVVALDDGSVMRIGYAGQNGHPYYAIGRELVKRQELSKQDVSLQSIRAWLEANPDQAMEIMNTNKSYVFFRELKKAGPVGGQGVALTPQRSLAIDHSKIPYGVPVWVDLAHPNEKDRIRRLMVAQDTGGAIRGAVRGDYFWGYGKEAENLAGLMKSEGEYWFLIPKLVTQ